MKAANVALQMCLCYIRLAVCFCASVYVSVSVLTSSDVLITRESMEKILFITVAVKAAAASTLLSILNRAMDTTPQYHQLSQTSVKKSYLFFLFFYSTTLLMLHVTTD